MEIPEGGILVRLLPFHQPSLPATPPPTASRFKRITEYSPYGITAGGMNYNVDIEIKLYDGPDGGDYKTIKSYTEPYDGKTVPLNVVQTILAKYIDTTDANVIKKKTQNGGRFSRKKYKKSFKQRGRSMKRYVSKSRKYRIRK